MEFKKVIREGGYYTLNKKFISVLGLECAMYYSYLLSWWYYHEKNGTLRERDDKSLWAYCSAGTIKNDTGLSTYQQKNALKTLEDIGLISTKILGIPATTHYQIFENKFLNFLKLDVKNFKTRFVKFDNYARAYLKRLVIIEEQEQIIKNVLVPPTPKKSSSDSVVGSVCPDNLTEDYFYSVLKQGDKILSSDIPDSILLALEERYDVCRDPEGFVYVLPF